MPPSTPYGQLFFVIDHSLESGKNIYIGSEIVHIPLK